MSYSSTLFAAEALGCLPEIFLTLCCLVELMVTLFRTAQPPYPLEARPVVRRVTFYLAVSVALMLWWPDYQAWAMEGRVFWSGALQLNLALVYTKVAIAGFALFVLVTANPYLAAHRANNFEFGILVGLATVAMWVVVSAYNLVILYLALELQALLFFILLAWRRRSRWSLEATLKYVLVNLVSSIFFLFSLTRFLANAGVVAYPALASQMVGLLNATLPASLGQLSWGVLMNVEQYSAAFQTLWLSMAHLIESGWFLALLALLISFSIKLGVAPFHLWVPTIYQRGVLPGVALLHTAAKVAYTAALSVLLGYVFFPLLPYWQWFFLAVALYSVVWGNLAMLHEHELTRLLACSAIASGGYLYIILALAPSIYFYPLAVFYAILSAFLSCHWFLVMQTTYLLTPTVASTGPVGIRFVADLAALRYSSGHKGWAVALALNICSLMGLPPLVGFWSKFLTYTTYTLAITEGTGITAGGVVYLAVIMLATLIGAVTYLRILAAILFEEPTRVQSYLPVAKGFHWCNLGLALLNVSFIFWNWDLCLTSLTPYYSSTAGFMWWG
jgi:NADH-quinone oxidoreductase subunit N